MLPPAAYGVGVSFVRGQKMRRASRAGLVIGLVLATTLVVAAPAYAETIGSRWDGDASDVGIEVWQNNTPTAWTANLGQTGGGVVATIRRQWFDIWFPATYTQFGIVWQCASSSTSSSGLQWFGGGKNGLEWSTLVDSPYYLSTPFGCVGAGETVQYVGVIRRTWLATQSAPAAYTVILGTGARGTCALPGANTLSGGGARTCMTAAGATSAAWLAGSGTVGAGADYIDIGLNVDASVCNTQPYTRPQAYPVIFDTSGTRKGSPIMITYDGPDGGSTNGTFGFGDGSTWGVKGFPSAWNLSGGSTDWRALEAQSGYIGYMYWWGPQQATIRMGIGGAFQGVTSDSAAPFSTSSTTNPTIGRINPQSLPDYGHTGYGPYNPGGLTTLHHVHVWCLTNPGANAAASIPSPVRGSIPSTLTCAQLSVLFNGVDTPMVAPGCWNKIGDFDVAPGQVGTPTNPSGANPPAETACTGLALECAMKDWAKSAGDFLASLTDLPQAVSKLLQALFVPSSYSLDQITGLRDSLLQRPPASIVSGAITTAAAIPAVFSTSSSCTNQTWSFTNAWFSKSTTVNAPCSGPIVNATWAAMYTLLKFGLYGCTLWGVWLIARDSIRN